MSYDSKLKRDDIDELFEAILTLRDVEDCYRFFEDICTINEIHSISQRLQVAKLLSEKKTYTEIEAQTSASTATISRINKCLVYGADGYKRVLERLSEKKMKNSFQLFLLNETIGRTSAKTEKS
ncbi:MAG: YerC/YecD family TrpR-related protein [Anaerovoracaceae bacterium]